MKLIAICPCLNEEQHIEQYCKTYQFADEIIVVDGGSSDRSLPIASSFPNVTIKHFSGRIPVVNGPEPYRNREGDMWNYCLAMFKESKGDWMMWGAVDEFPNKSLAKDARKIMSKTDKTSIHVYRINMWGEDHYFPKMMPKDWRVIWAWKPEAGVRFTDVDYHSSLVELPKDPLVVNPPYSMMHNFFPDEASVERKKKRYKSWGINFVDPHTWIYAPPEKMKAWMLAERNW